MFKTRLAKLQDTLKHFECDALIIDDPVNLYYMTGLDLSAGKLLVENMEAFLFVDGRYFEACKIKSPFQVHLLDSKHLETKLSSVKRLGFDSSTTPFKNYLTLKKELEAVSKAELIPIDAPLQALRAIKDEHEIKLLKEAADLGSEGFDYVCTLLKEGITEIEVAIELEIFWKRKGSKGLAFDPIIAFGANSSMPHYRAADVKLQNGDPVLIDIGVNLKHYHSDMTRMAYFGTPPAEIIKICEIVIKAQKKALTLCAPGTSFYDLDSAARDYIASEGYGDYFTHSLGHGVGLDIHEYPTIRKAAKGKQQGASSQQLTPGMVITIEPGIYLPNIGGVRIEDTVLITKDGHVNLTKRDTAPVIISA